MSLCSSTRALGLVPRRAAGLTLLASTNFQTNETLNPDLLAFLQSRP